MNLPDYVKTIIAALEAGGYDAYAVGGCVRDMLLGIQPQDYDVTTSAKPEEVKAALSALSGLSEGGCRVHDTGLKHGTVTVVIDDSPVEVTTFRIDGDYTDNRRPDSVTFTDSLHDDLSRRDFTVNAMAFSEKTGIVDYFGGRADLEKKLVRAVGSPEKRFSEDGLRIIRALRFAAVYGFSVEEDTANAVRRLRGLIGNIARERIAQELNKLVCGKVSGVIADYADVFAEFIPEIAVCKGFDQRTKYHDKDVLAHTLAAMDFSPPDKVTRLALLFHDLGKPEKFVLNNRNGELYGSFKGHASVSAEIARRVMRELKYDNDTFNKVLTLVRYHDIPIKPCEQAVKRLLNRFGTGVFGTGVFGEELFFKLADVHIADDSAKAPVIRERANVTREAVQIAKRIIAEQSCYSLKQLAVKGGDLAELGYKGREIGAKLNVLLQAVISGKCANDKSGLLNFLEGK